MQLTKTLRFGFSQARQHKRLVLLIYLASLLPAFLVLTVFGGGLAPALDSSLFASEALRGNVFGVLMDFQRSPAGNVSSTAGLLPLRLLLSTVLQILVAAGVVEVLLQRHRPGDHPFLQGIARNGWRFLRSALVFVLTLGVLLGLLGAAHHGVRKAALASGAGGTAFYALGATLLLGYLLYAWADLAYDLSRIAAAAQGEKRMLFGLLRGLAWVARHPLTLLGLHAVFTVLTLGVTVGYLTLRSRLDVQGWGSLAAVILGQQLIFLLTAFFRLSFWGAEVAYYQGVGEPHLCRPRRPRPTPANTNATAEAKPPEPDPTPDTSQTLDLAAVPSPEGATTHAPPAGTSSPEILINPTPPSMGDEPEGSMRTTQDLTRRVRRILAEEQGPGVGEGMPVEAANDEDPGDGR